MQPNNAWGTKTSLADKLREQQSGTGQSTTSKAVAAAATSVATVMFSVPANRGISPQPQQNHQPPLQVRSAVAIPQSQVVARSARYSIQDCFIVGYKPQSAMVAGENRQTWVKRVWVKNGQCNFWNGTHNIFLALEGDLTAQSVFDLLKTGDYSVNPNPLTYATTIPVEATLRQQFDAIGYIISDPHVVMHDDRLGKYMEVVFEFPSKTSGQSANKKGKFETQVLTIHFRHDDAQQLYRTGTGITDKARLDAAIQQEILAYIGRLSAGEVVQNMNAITQCSYNGRVHDVLQDTRMQ